MRHNIGAYIKWLVRLVFLLPLGVLLFSCSGEDNGKPRKNLLPSVAAGGFSDIIVVVEREIWNSSTLKEDLAFVFQKNISGLFKAEPSFDFTQVPRKGFTDLFKNQRHILEIKIDQRTKNIGVFEPVNKFAKNQKYIKIIGRNIEEVSNLIYQQHKDLYEHFNQHRFLGLKQQAFENRNPKLVNQLRKNHQLTIAVPKGYNQVKSIPGFVYFSKQAKTLCPSNLHQQCYYQTGIFVHYYPYKKEGVFKPDHILNLRDSLTQEFLLGPDRAKKTYMEYEKSFPVSFSDGVINGDYCKVGRGWWNMVNATMGGPFINLSFYDTKNNRIIMMDAYCFAPNFSKRDFIMELEAIARTIKTYD